VDHLPLLPGKIVKSIACSNPLMAGEFVDESGQPYVMIVNLSQEHSALFTFTTDSKSSIKLISAVDGSIRPFDSKEGLWLTPGQGVLLSVKPYE